MPSRLIGTRIREQRRKQRMSQRALAMAAGLSPSYLNLIEHNRRGIAGARLSALARALSVPLSDLTEGPERALMTELQAVIAERGYAQIDTGTVESMIAQFPDWTALITGLDRQNRDLREAIEVLTDRLGHDPFLAETLHAVLSNVTAIRSTAGILATVDDIDPPQQKRFLNIIHAESRRLSDAASALSDYLDRAAHGRSAAATPEEAADRFMAQHAYAFPTLDAAPSDGAAEIDALVHAAAQLDTPTSQGFVRTLLADYARDAQALPLAMFSQVARDTAYNPVALHQHFGGDKLRILRRLAVLRRTDIDAPRFGLLIANAAGQALWRRPLGEFSLPRHGAACALWPLFQALSQPDRISLHRLHLPEGSSVIALALAEPAMPSRFGEAPNYHAAMLLLPPDSQPQVSSWLPKQIQGRDVGTACPICPRAGCEARTRASYLASDASARI